MKRYSPADLAFCDYLDLLERDPGELRERLEALLLDPAALELYQRFRSQLAHEQPDRAPSAYLDEVRQPILHGGCHGPELTDAALFRLLRDTDALFALQFEVFANEDAASYWHRRRTAYWSDAALAALTQANEDGAETAAALQDELCTALEVARYLAGEDRPPTGPEAAGVGDIMSALMLTDVVVQDKAETAEVAQPRVRHWIGAGLFAILEAVEIDVPAVDEVAEAGRMLRHLIGREAVQGFRRLSKWLQARRASTTDRTLDQLLRRQVPRLFEQERDAFRYHLSYRLYLRERLKEYCERRGWQPAGLRYRDLDTAFADLSRARIGAIVRDEVAKLEEEPAARRTGIRPWEVGVLMEQHQ